ncbi:class I SAM-dependent methyltransferase [Thermococcus sp. Bubb.Bath]|uniref:class I SAM-dependent methyltransferase n=1 Tax=Thermococcus sp. Bubb.Bath TaxID=1638242 RepID=UPI00143967E8|nr:class I SAM-dependent methyltransferase [Thermococcus sp. Bubb.Bath]NJF25269.1 class I SAM-dependent methyltransferase [Thermococcus sp. Bubb.Bath]
MTFEKYYTVFNAYSDIYSDEYRKRIETLEPLLLKYMPKKGRVLDLACGVGGFSFLLEDMGFDVVGIDSSGFMIERAKEYAKEKRSKVEFILGDARELPFEENSFDYVLFIGDSIVHFDPPVLNSTFKEVARVLKPGGRMLLHFLDLRTFLPKLTSGQVIGAEYWISKVLTDPDEKSAVIEFQSEKDSFRVRFNVWGKTAVDLLTNLYFRKIAEEKVNEYSYFQVYVPKK